MNVDQKSILWLTYYQNVVTISTQTRQSMKEEIIRIRTTSIFKDRIRKAADEENKTMTAYLVDAALEKMGRTKKQPNRKQNGARKSNLLI